MIKNKYVKLLLFVIVYLDLCGHSSSSTPILTFHLGEILSQSTLDLVMKGLESNCKM